VQGALKRTNENSINPLHISRNYFRLDWGEVQSKSQTMNKLILLILLLPLSSFSQETILAYINTGFNAMAVDSTYFSGGANTGGGFLYYEEPTSNNPISIYYNLNATYNSISVNAKKYQFIHTRIGMGLTNGTFFAGLKAGFLYSTIDETDLHRGDVGNTFSFLLEAAILPFPINDKGRIYGGLTGEIGTFKDSPFRNLDLPKTFASASIFIGFKI